jgi:hypothetical protein
MNFWNILFAQKHGASPTGDFFEELLAGYTKPSEVKTLTGIPPLTFVSDGSSLKNWAIFGADPGVGERTKNLIQVPSINTIDRGVKYISDSEKGIIVANRQSVGTNDSSVTFSVLLDAGSYRFTCNNDSSFTTYDAYVRDLSVTIARDNPKLSPGQYFTLAEPETVTLYFRIRPNYDAQNLIFAPMVQIDTGDTNDTFEPYGYKIPVTCGGVTTTIYTQSQLMDGDVLTLADTGVDIPTTDGNNTLTVGTTVQPSNMTIVYNGK